MPFIAVLWVVSLPVLRLAFPLLAKPLDGLGIERMATVGYHVVAVKKNSASQNRHSEQKNESGVPLRKRCCSIFLLHVHAAPN